MINHSLHSCGYRPILGRKSSTIDQSPPVGSPMHSPSGCPLAWTSAAAAGSVRPASVRAASRSRDGPTGVNDERLGKLDRRANRLAAGVIDESEGLPMRQCAQSPPALMFATGYVGLKYCNPTEKPHRGPASGNARVGRQARDSNIPDFRAYQRSGWHSSWSRCSFGSANWHAGIAQCNANHRIIIYQLFTRMTENSN